MTRILVIDDDRTVPRMISRWFEESDTEVLTAATAQEGMELVQSQRPDVLLLDIMLPHLSGLEAYQTVRDLDPKLPVIYITGHGSSEMAIESMKLGAYDYLQKPLDKDRVLDLVKRAAEMRRLMNRPVAVSQEDATPIDSDGDAMLGQSEAMQRVFKAIGRVAQQDVTVLIQGDSGTGKELVARAIYQHSSRSNGPFLAVNCAAIPETLLESEFFGHEKGSFTGADSRRIGKFEQCSGGTIFLDEIGDMPALLQSKILRLLQEQKFERVGGNQTIHTDVRIIAATNRDLDALVREEKFREDLLYRLKGFLICLPPLRDREGDLNVLINHFLAVYSAPHGQEHHADRARGDAGAGELRLARQRARAGKRSQAGIDQRHRHRDHQGLFARGALQRKFWRGLLDAGCFRGAGGSAAQWLHAAQRPGRVRRAAAEGGQPQSARGDHRHDGAIPADSRTSSDGRQPVGGLEDSGYHPRQPPQQDPRFAPLDRSGGDGG